MKKVGEVNFPPLGKQKGENYTHTQRVNKLSKRDKTDIYSSNKDFDEIRANVNNPNINVAEMEEDTSYEMNSTGLCFINEVLFKFYI